VGGGTRPRNDLPLPLLVDAGARTIRPFGEEIAVCLSAHGAPVQADILQQPPPVQRRRVLTNERTRVGPDRERLARRVGKEASLGSGDWEGVEEERQLSLSRSEESACGAPPATDGPYELLVRAFVLRANR